MDTSAVTFEGIRKTLIETLSANQIFKDYNFEAPALASLMDALAYVTHYHVRYSNFALNESFLDSAQLRHNIVSKAKDVAYIPYQYSAARAKLRIKITDNTLNIEEGTKIPEDTMFIATSNYGVSYIFRTVDQFVFEKNTSENYWFADIEVVEGTWAEESFTQDEYYTNRFYLLNDRVDTDFLSVIVFINSTFTVGEEFIPVENIESFGPDIPIYFLQEAYNGKIEIYFGDGVLSKKLVPDNIIKVKYLVTNGGNANNIINFSLMNMIADKIDASSIEIQVIEQSHSGGDRESNESIRFNANKFFQRQDRNVTTSDYNVAVLSKFGGWIDSITSWGGEDNVPPQYAKVFICVKPKYTNVLSPSQKERIAEFLNKKNLPCVEPVIVDPAYINVVMTLNIDWKQYQTALTKKEITEMIDKCVRNFFDTNVTTFKTTFRYSKFLSEINDLDDSIDSILSNIQLKQILYPDTNIETTYTFSFLNRIQEGSLLIGPWTIDGTTEQFSMYDLNGYVYVSGTSGYKEIIGNVDYSTGEIKIKNYLFGKGADTQIPVVVSMYSQNINLAKNYLLALSNLTININEIITYKS